MSSPKEKIRLIAEEISFGKHHITYKVKPDLSGLRIKKLQEGFVACAPDIKDKDLLLKTNYFDPEKMTLSFIPVNVTTVFYQDIMEQTIKHPMEFSTELESIYAVGDVVGYIIAEQELK